MDGRESQKQTKRRENAKEYEKRSALNTLHSPVGGRVRSARGKGGESEAHGQVVTEQAITPPHARGRKGQVKQTQSTNTNTNTGDNKKKEHQQWTPPPPKQHGGREGGGVARRSGGEGRNARSKGTRGERPTRGGKQRESGGSTVRRAESGWHEEQRAGITHTHTRTHS